MSAAFDTVAMSSYRQIHMDMAANDEERLEIEINKDPSMGLFDLQIFTYPSRAKVNYANTEHIDENDSNDDIFNKAMEQKLEKYLEIWLKKLSSAQHEHERNLCKKNIKAILHLFRRGTRGGTNDNENNNQLKFSTDTTCAYQVLFTGENMHILAMRQWLNSK